MFCPLCVPGQVAAPGPPILTGDRLQQEALGMPSFSPQRGKTMGSREQRSPASYLCSLRAASISSARALAPGQGHDGHSLVHPQRGTNPPISFTPPQQSSIRALLSRRKVWHIPASILLFLFLLPRGAAGLSTYPQCPGASQPHFRAARGCHLADLNP